MCTRKTKTLVSTCVILSGMTNIICLLYVGWVTNYIASVYVKVQEPISEKKLEEDKGDTLRIIERLDHLENVIKQHIQGTTSPRLALHPLPLRVRLSRISRMSRSAEPATAGEPGEPSWSRGWSSAQLSPACAFPKHTRFPSCRFRKFHFFFFFNFHLLFFKMVCCLWNCCSPPPLSLTPLIRAESLCCSG